MARIKLTVPDLDEKLEQKPQIEELLKYLAGRFGRKSKTYLRWRTVVMVHWLNRRPPPLYRLNIWIDNAYYPYYHDTLTAIRRLLAMHGLDYTVAGNAWAADLHTFPWDTDLSGNGVEEWLVRNKCVKLVTDL